MDHQYELSIFLAGDNKFDLFFTEKQLVNKGYQKVKVFTNCQDCLAKLGENPDVIFVDATVCQYGLQDGLSQIKRINPDIYLVVISDEFHSLDMDQLHDIGVFEFLNPEKDEVKAIERVLAKISSIKQQLAKANINQH